MAGHYVKSVIYQPKLMEVEPNNNMKYIYRNKKNKQTIVSDTKLTDKDLILIGTFRDAQIKSNDKRIIKK